MPFLQEKTVKKMRILIAAQWTAGRPAAAILDWIPGRVWQAIDAASATHVVRRSVGVKKS